MANKIYLDPGHGGSDPGAVGHGIREKDVVLKIGRYTRDYLQDNFQNVQIRMSRAIDKFLSLYARANDANNWGADVFVSIHINAGGGVGYEDFIYNGPVSSQTKTLQDNIHAELSKHFTTNRGQKRANYAVLRESKMPAVLTENGFIDNKRDADFLKSDANLRKLAESHAEGIAKTLGLKRKAGRTQTTNTEGDLTVEQYKELKKLIDNQSKEIDRLQEQLDQKEDIPAERDVASSHKEAWEWLIDLGATTGVRPYEDVRREQLATILMTYDQKRFPTDDNVSASHQEAWDWLIENGITSGGNPRRPLTREQFATMLKTAYENLPKQ